MAKDTAPSATATAEVVDSQTAFIPEPPVNIEPEEVLPTTTDTTYTPLPANNQVLNLSEVFAHTNMSAPNYYPTWFDTAAVTEPALPEINLPVASPEIPVAEPATTVSSNNTKSYHVIGGVFCNEENARKFYNKLKAQGFEAELLLNPKINCNRVSYRKCATRQEAAALIDSLNNVEKSDIWILPVKE
jgi:cell division septation protein DedD